MALSTIILTHNSQDTLPRTLKSVAFSDEVIVIDDASTDNTQRIAKKAGVRIVLRALKGDFAAQRNAGLREASHEWVLFVDADETVSHTLAHEIREAIGRMDVQGFYLKRDDVVWGRVVRYGETAHVKLLRLARKGAGTWVRPVHEVWNVTGPVGTLNTPLQHTPHPDVAHFLADINDYSTINARHLFDTGVRTSWLFIIGYPIAKFIHNYIMRLGFLDGMPGLLIALMMSFHSFLTRGKLWMHINRRAS